MATTDPTALPSAGEELPELANVHWRPRVTERSLRRAGWSCTAWMCGHTIPFILGAALLVVLGKPVTIVIALVLLVHAWAFPELYAWRGAGVMRPRPVNPRARAIDPLAEQVSRALLESLLDAPARELYERTGLALQRGALGTWVVGEAGALLVRPGGRRVNCYCVRVTGDGLPVGDRISHLLLGLRSDEVGFTTLANLAFSGAPWRLRRRLAPGMRPALAAAVAAARAR